MIQDVRGAVDDAHHAMTEHYSQMLDQFKDKLEKQQQEVDKQRQEATATATATANNAPQLPTLNPNRRFPNARIPSSPYRPNRLNPYSTPVKSNTTQGNHSSATSLPDHINTDPTAGISYTGQTVHLSEPIPQQPPPHSMAQDPVAPANGSYLRYHQSTGEGYSVSGHSVIPQTVPTGSVFLPPVNHDQALKRAKIQFSGLGDIFVFYNQLMNAMEQFGIYLLPLPQVKYQHSLCPDSYGGTLIDKHRKQVMAGTLYQKLQSHDVIPLEYTAMRNIINRYAEKNDGYDVLYAMLELVHPALQKDAVMCPPKSSECGDDIHLYAQKFDAWLRYESYANRPYSPREQINKFVNELSPVFAPAISRIRRLLDAWNHYDLTVPEVLKITALPNTIERFMNEEAGNSTAYIRKIM
jgi:hypothetical protein